MFTATRWRMAVLLVLAACGGEAPVQTLPLQTKTTASSSRHQVAPPTFSPAPGTYTSTVSVTLSDATAGAVIYYSTDGTTPSAASTRYSGPITLGVTTTIKAIGVENGFSNSAVASATYTIQVSTSPVATPTFDPAPGAYEIPWGSDYTLWVSLSDATPGAAIYYTFDGTTPTAGSFLYTGPIDLGFTANSTITAVAIVSGVTSSPASGTYVLTQTYPGSCVVNNGLLTGDCVTQTYLGCLDGPSTACTASATSSGGYLCGAIPVDNKTCSFVGPPLQPF